MYGRGDGTAARAALAAEMRRRADAMRGADPLTEDWSAAERSEYGGLSELRPSPAAGGTGPVPAMVRETLISIGGESPDDDVRRALSAISHQPSAISEQRTANSEDTLKAEG